MNPAAAQPAKKACKWGNALAFETRKAPCPCGRHTIYTHQETCYPVPKPPPRGGFNAEQSLFLAKRLHKLEKDQELIFKQRDDVLRTLRAFCGGAEGLSLGAVYAKREALLAGERQSLLLQADSNERRALKRKLGDDASVAGESVTTVATEAGSTTP